MLLLFYFFSLILILSSLMVIISKNPIHSVLFLVLSFFNVAALLILLKIEFISIIFIIVYVGAIAVLFLFCVMMLNIKLVEISSTMFSYIPLSSVIGLIFIFESFFILFNYFNIGNIPINNLIINSQYIDWVELLNNNYINIIAIGQIIYTRYLSLFIIASLILLVAMVCSIALTLNTRYTLRRQLIFKQLARDYSKTIYFIQH